jgi:Domain of unknown function (DUF4062)/NB-ARC domain/MalT-like TPR region
MDSETLKSSKRLGPLKIFISSTYLDLISYREVVTNALRKQGHDVIQMEFFAAREEEPNKVAKSELRKCDVVVGIYAHRYGSIPDENDYSITEQEYWHAKSRGKPVFCFIVNEDQPWPPKMMEREPEKVDKLNKFIEVIRKEKTVDFFTTPENLASQVSAAIGRYTSELSEQPYIQATDRPITSLPYLPYFFGRENKLKDIADAISANARTWGVLIDGPGGIGKTALAIKAAHEAPDGLFDRKIFITAKIRELTPSGEQKLNEYARINYLALLSELALELGEDSIQRLNEEDRANALRRALTKQRVLIIFDNLETLEDSEASRLYQFLSLLPEGNKAIVTSRRRSDVEAKVIRLDRLNANEAKELISELAKNNELLRGASSDEKQLLNLYTGGNPLLIKWIVGQLGREGSNLRTITQAIEFIKRVPRDKEKSEENNPLQYIFGDLIETLSSPEKIVLAAITHIGLVTSDSFKWISQMSEDDDDAQLPKGSIENMLDELSNRSILISNKKYTEYYLPEVTAGFIRSKMPHEVSLAGHRLAKYVIRIAKECDDHKDYSELKNKEWPAILSALPYFLKGENDDFQTLCRRLEGFLKSSGRWEELLWIYQNAEKKAENCGDYYSAGWRAYNVGLIYSYRGQSKEVLDSANRAKNYWEKLDPSKITKEFPLISYLYGIGHKLESNYAVAIKSFKESARRLKESMAEDSQIADVLNALAEAQMEYGDLPEAEENLNEALLIVRDDEDPGVILIYKGNLAELALAQRDWAKAEKLALEALKLAEEIGQQEEIAQDNYRIARALLLQGNVSLASSYALKSVNIYTRLRHPYLPEAVEVLMRSREERQKKTANN